MIESTIIERFEEVRMDNNLSKNAFCGKAGINSSNYTKKIKGDIVITEKDIGGVCKAFGVSPNWLRTGEGEKYLALNRDENVLNIKGEIINLARQLTKNKELMAQLALENENLMSQLSALYTQLDKHQM